MTISKHFDEMTHEEQDVILYSVSDDRETLHKVMAACDPDHVYNIEITVNGIKVDAEKFVARYNEAFAGCVDRAAVVKVSEKFREMAEAFQPIKDMLDAAEQKIARDLGIERDSWGDY